MSGSDYCANCGHARDQHRAGGICELCIPVGDQSGMQSGCQEFAQAVGRLQNPPSGVGLAEDQEISVGLRRAAETISGYCEDCCSHIDGLGRCQCPDKPAAPDLLRERDALRAANEKLDAQMEILADKHASLQAEVEAYRQQRDALAEDLRRSKAFQAEESAAIADLLAENERLRTSRPKCQHCGKPASCLGRYDTMPAWTFACDDCCGHGNEDGTCYALENVAFEFSHLDDAHRQAVEQRDALQAELRETGGIQAMARLNKKLTAQRDALADALEVGMFDAGAGLHADGCANGRRGGPPREEVCSRKCLVSRAALRLAGRLPKEES